MSIYRNGNEDNQWRILPLYGLRKMKWLIKRFLYVRIILNWAWEPDRYDFDSRVEQWGLYRGKKLVGGVRLFYVNRIEDTLQYRVPSFRLMIKDSIWFNLRYLENDLVEATRLLIFPPILRTKEKYVGFRWISRRICTSMIHSNRPFLLAVVNPFTLRLIESTKAADVKIIGKSMFDSKNRMEYRSYGSHVPHYAILVNFVNTIKALDDPLWWCKEVKLSGDWFSGKLDRAAELWESLGSMPYSWR